MSALRAMAAAVGTALCAALIVIAADPPAKKTAKAAPSKSSAKKATSKKTTAKKAATKKTTAKKTAPIPKQTQPAPGRYREIQQALADKGYFRGSVDGNWGPESVDALKRFQRDQKIGDDGKLGALSLIALGLGPQRSTPSSPRPQP